MHYQTAYRWVRTGTLAAEKVGGTYSVSDEAVEATRRARTRPATASNSLAELFTQAVSSGVSAEGDDLTCIQLAVRIAAERIGDASFYARVVGPDQLAGVAYFHSDVERQIVNRRFVQSTVEPPFVDSCRRAIDDGRVVALTGLDALGERSQFDEAFVAATGTRGVALAPVAVGPDVVGVIGVLRESSPSITTAEAADLEGVSELLSGLLAQVG